MSQKEYDIIIIGGGPAGLAAGLYAARAMRKTLVMEKYIPGGQMTLSSGIENYPAFGEGISGTELGQKMENDAEKFGAEIEAIEAEEIVDEGAHKIIRIKDGSQYRCKALILTMGSAARKLGISGETEFLGKGVSNCATCDAMFFRDKDVVVIGGGDAAVEEGTFLTRYAAQVRIIHRRDQLRAQKLIQKRAFENPKVEFVFDTIVTEILGDDKVNAVRTKNVKTEEEKVLETNGVFIFIGYIPNTSVAKGLVEMNEREEIIVNQRMETSVPGVFAAGDLLSHTIRQIVTAAGEGATAGFFADKYIDNL